MSEHTHDHYEYGVERDYLGGTRPIFRWYDDINDYQRMCVPCHRQFDAKRRNETGHRTSPVRR